ncbi:MAG: hypothetical protein V7629_07910 [Motiliproteus sp.]
MMNKSSVVLSKILPLCAGAVAVLVAGGVEAKTVDANQALAQGTPWATTAIYQDHNGKPRKTDNFINDNSISAGTISSAQYRSGVFLFVSMSDFTTGEFDENTLVSSLQSVAGGFGSPQGFAYGDYEIIKDVDGNAVRRIRNASFAPFAVIDREITTAKKREFTYSFTAGDGSKYHVEHKPYDRAFRKADYPDALQTAVDQFFETKLTDEKLANYALTSASPWATTAIYLQVNGAPDKSINFIDNASISAGTISSAQYRDGHFLFLSMTDYRTGELDVTSLSVSLATVAAGQGSPQGFAHGDYEVIQNDQGNRVRRITNASFAPTAVIDRQVTTATADEFTYTFTASNGSTYYVEHKPYTSAFSGKAYPKKLQRAVDQFFAVQ